MANQKLTDRNLMNEQLHDDDVIHIVDVSDTTDSPEGTSKKWKILTWLKTLFEDKSNKKTTLSDNSDTYYPTQKAVKTAVDAKQDALGYIAENAANKKTDLTDNSDTYYPTQKAVKTAVDAKQDTLGFTPENVANKVTSFQATPDDTHYPSEKLVKDSLDAKAPTANPTFTGTVTLPKTTEVKGTTGDHQYVLAVSELTADRTY